MSRFAMVMVLILILLQNNPASSEIFAPNSYRLQVDAKEILTKIERGEDVNYGPNSIIVGDLDSSKMNNKYVSSKIKVNSEIRGEVNFESMIFAQEVDFSDSIFFDKVNFGYCNFQKGCNFRLSHFAKRADFSSSVFNSESLFNEASFGNSAIFEKTQFLGSTYFDGSEFERFASFYDSSIIGTSSFIGTKFAGGSDFSLASFWENCQFQDSSFDRRVLFRGTAFQKEASFLNSEFRGDVDFRGAKFKDLAQFSFSIFEKTAYFNSNPAQNLTGTIFAGDLILNSTKIHSMILQDAVFSNNSHIFLQNSEFANLMMRWDDLKNRLPFDGQVYLALIKNFKDQEQFSDADECYYQYRYESMRGPLDYVSWISCGYGVRPYYTLFVSIGFILLFGGIFGLGRGIQRTNSSYTVIFSKDYTKKRRVHLRGIFEALFFSLQIFTFQTKGEWKATGPYRVVAALEGILGLVLFGLFSVTLINIMIRY